MDKDNMIKAKLRAKRALAENKIRQLEKEGKAGERYTALIPDMKFLIVGLLCDAGWIIHIVSEINYLKKYAFHSDSRLMTAFDIMSLAALAAVAFGVAAIVRLSIIHEKEIATRLQKNLSFGLTVYGGLAAGLIGIFQLITTFSSGTGGIDFLAGVIIGGFMNFAFGLPIFLSFKKGIFYSGEDH